MSNPFSEAPLESLPQWQAILTACPDGCPMPTPEGPPTRQSESVDGTGYAMILPLYSPPTVEHGVGLFPGNEEEESGWYRGELYTFYNGDWQRDELEEAYCVGFGAGVLFYPDLISTEQTGGPPEYGEDTITHFGGPVDWDATRAAAFGTMAAAVVWESLAPGDTNGYPVAIRANYLPLRYVPLGYTTLVYARFVRFRWSVPSSHTGTWYKVMWDVIEQPSDDRQVMENDAYFGTSTPVPVADPVVVSRDNSWEWTGPGNPEDPATWRSPWFDLPPPSSSGTRRVVNVRYFGYRGPFGSLPMLTGEQIGLPDP